jgi:hypothetical protein
MAKGEARNTNRYIDQERQRTGQQYDTLDRSMMDRLSGAQGRADRTFESAYGGYNDLLGRSRAGSGGGGSGGYDEIYSRFKNFGDTGGIDDENKRRIRGSGVFDEFARTGGLNEADKQNLRARSTATLPAFFENLKNQLSQRNAIQGGYSPGYDAQASKLARDQAYGANRVAADAEGDIVDRVTRGRQWGAENISGAEQGLVDLLSRNKLAGFEGMLNSRRASSDDDYRGRALDLEGELGALSGLRGLRTDQPGEEFGLYDRLIGSAGQRGGQNQSNLGLRAEYNPNVSTFDRVSQIAQAVGPLAMAAMTGGASIPATAAAQGASSMMRGRRPTQLPRQRNLWGSVYGGG